MKFSEKQRRLIRAEAIASTVEDCMHQSYLQRVVAKYVDAMTSEEQLELISSEHETLINLLGFDPTTGRKA